VVQREMMADSRERSERIEVDGCRRIARGAPLKECPFYRRSVTHAWCAHPRGGGLTAEEEASDEAPGWCPLRGRVALIGGPRKLATPPPETIPSPQPGDTIELVDEDDPDGPVCWRRADGSTVAMMTRAAFEWAWKRGSTEPC
jgi:hypothetical protein